MNTRLDQPTVTPPPSQEFQPPLQSPALFLVLTFVVPVAVILLLGLVDFPKLLGL